MLDLNGNIKIKRLSDVFVLYGQALFVVIRSRSPWTRGDLDPSRNVRFPSSVFADRRVHSINDNNDHNNNTVVFTPYRFRQTRAARSRIVFETMPFDRPDRSLKRDTRYVHVQIYTFRLVLERFDNDRNTRLADFHETRLAVFGPKVVKNTTQNIISRT